MAILVKKCNLLLAVEPHGRLGRASRLGLALPSGGLSYQCHCVRTHPTFGVGRLLPVEGHLRHVAPVVRLDVILANVHAAAQGEGGLGVDIEQRARERAVSRRPRPPAGPAASNPNDAFCFTWSEHAGTPAVSRHTRQGEDADKKLTSADPWAVHVVVGMASSPDVALVSCSGSASGAVASTVTSNGVRAVQLVRKRQLDQKRQPRLVIRTLARASDPRADEHARGTARMHALGVVESIVGDVTRVALEAQFVVLHAHLAIERSRPRNAQAAGRSLTHRARGACVHHGRRLRRVVGRGSELRRRLIRHDCRPRPDRGVTRRVDCRHTNQVRVRRLQRHAGLGA
eukprot:scaffold22785_cov72-Phaeocystis_antarctica.AAC.1